MSNSIIPPPPGHEPERFGAQGEPAPAYGHAPLVDAQELPSRVTGYMDQSEEKVALVNEVKDFEIYVANAWKLHRETIGRSARNVAESMRQMAMARTAFEEGFMHWCRAIWGPQDPFIEEVERKS